MKNIKIKEISSIENFDNSIERHPIDIVNWLEYPYTPQVSFQMAYTTTHIYIKYFVTEKNIKATYLIDNESVWENSCVEFFVKLPDSEYYYNFEINCIGTVLGAKKRNKSESIRLTDEELKRVIRIGSLSHEKIDIKDNSEPWNILVGIPFELFGCNNRPNKIMANLYKCGDKTDTPHFLSWSPIDNPKPNFHLPQFFGEITLE